MSRVKRRYKLWLARMAARGKAESRNQSPGSRRGALDVELFHSDFEF
jgi:hypothetical protein